MQIYTVCYCVYRIVVSSQIDLYVLYFICYAATAINKKVQFCLRLMVVYFDPTFIKYYKI